MDRYKVYRLYRKTARKRTLETGLTKDEAKRCVASFPDSPKSMVCFTKM